MKILGMVVERVPAWLASLGEPDGGDYDHDGDYYSLLASNISYLVQMRKQMIIKGIVEEGNCECCDNDESNIALLIVRIICIFKIFHLHQNFSMV